MHLYVDSVSAFWVLAVFVGVLLLFLYWFHIHSLHLSYWKDQGVPYIKPDWILGSVTDEVLKKSSWNDYSIRCYTTFKENGFGGGYILCKPVLVICDPSLIEKVLVNDFTYFHDRGYTDCTEPLAKTLFNARGEKWRVFRQSVIPSFASVKVKGMFDQVLKCSDYVIMEIGKTSFENHSVELESLLFVYVAEVIASCVFGVSLISNSKEAENFKNIISLVNNTNPVRTVKYFVSILFPKLFNYLGLQLYDQSVTNFFVNLTKASIEYRLKNNIVRNDFLQLMICLRDREEKFEHPEELCVYPTVNQQQNFKASCSLKPLHPSRDNLVSDYEIAAFLFNFVTAGLNPSVGIISFVLLEIAKNITIQEKLHAEIRNAINKHKEWNYEALKNMTYLDQVIQEAMRMYNFNSFLTREVIEPYQLPGSNLVLDKGMLVYIPVTGLHMDSQRYPSPQVFDPERFAGNNYKPNPFYLPFGNGPRICISIKFAVLIIKTCLAKVLYQYHVNLSSKMQLPLVFDKNKFYPKAEGGVWLIFTER